MKKYFLLVISLMLTACLNDSEDAPDIQLTGDQFTTLAGEFSLMLPAGWSHSTGEKFGSTKLDVVSRMNPLASSLPMQARAKPVLTGPRPSSVNLRSGFSMVSLITFCIRMTRGSICGPLK